MIEYIENFFDVKDYDKNNPGNLTVEIINKVEELYGKKIKPFPSAVHMAAYHFTPGEECNLHSDWEGRSNVTTLFYLNDDYTDGQIYFPDYNVEIKPTSGALLVFDSAIIHGVKKFSGANRHSVGAWWNFMEDNND